MRKLILFLCLTVFASALQAQTTAPPAAKDCVWKSIWTPFGTGTEWAHNVTEFGGTKVAWWVYWCPQPDGSWSPVTQRCVVGRGCMDPRALSQVLDTAARSADPVAALRQARDQFTLPPLPGELGAWDMAESDMLAAAIKLKPATTVWKVAPNPASTTVPPTRPMFSAADPSKQVAERATVGATCNCRAPVAKGTQTLCPLAATTVAPAPTTNLTSCTKQ